jgi:hypothetical protein
MEHKSVQGLLMDTAGKAGISLCYARRRPGQAWRIHVSPNESPHWFREGATNEVGQITVKPSSIRARQCVPEFGSVPSAPQNAGIQSRMLPCFAGSQWPLARCPRGPVRWTLLPRMLLGGQINLPLPPELREGPFSRVELPSSDLGSVISNSQRHRGRSKLACNPISCPPPTAPEQGKLGGQKSKSTGRLALPPWTGARRKRRAALLKDQTWG